MIQTSTIYTNILELFNYYDKYPSSKTLIYRFQVKLTSINDSFISKE